MAKSIVAIKRVAQPIAQETIDEAVRDAVMASCGKTRLIKPGDRVVLKPNIFAPIPPPATTDPRVVVALVRLAYEMGARDVIVAEGRSISTACYRKNCNSTRECAQLLGYPAVVESAGGKMVYFEEDEFVTISVPGGLVLKQAAIPKIILDADVLINVPAMKIHSLALITIGIKNLHGILSDEDKLFGHDYSSLPSKLADILRVRMPHLTVVDGVIGQEGDHAEDGKPANMGLIVAGNDVVSVDAICSTLMGIDPFEVDTTHVADQYGLGEADIQNIEVIGENIDSVRKPFIRPDIEISNEKFPNMRIIAGDHCKSCQYYIRRGLDRLADAGVPSDGEELTIVFGKDPQVPDYLPGRVILIGDCCLASRSVKRLRDHLLLQGRLKIVYACPPMEFRMRALDLSGD